MVRLRLRLAMTEEVVVSSGLQSSSFMLQTIPAADQALRNRNIRQESNIRTYKHVYLLSDDDDDVGDLEVLVGVAAEENDEEATDGEALDTKPDRDGTVLAVGDTEDSEDQHGDAEDKTAEEEDED